MRNWIQYFCKKPLLVNVVLFGVMLAAVLLWDKIGKEELPEFSMNFLRATIRYPGASAQDVELFITKPIEEKLKGVSGLYEVTSTSSYGGSSFRVTVDPNIRGFAFREKVQDIKEAIEQTELPRESEDPVYSQFNSQEKAIIDIGFYLEGKELLSVEDRQILQAYALAFKNRMLSLPQISGVEATGYLRPEIQIHVNPSKLIQKQISMATLGQEIIAQHVRVPAGSMTDIRESEVSLLGELNTPESIQNTIVQSGFEGQKIYVRDLATTKHGFERTNTLRKIQGHEAVIFNIQKSASVDILTAQKAVEDFTTRFLNDHESSGLRIVLMDDESYDVRNRLSIIGSNGLIGFVLIIFVLFLFLNFSTGFWVAMGIPFSLAFTLIGSMLLGFSINNMTLAAIIIVLGIVVDDAIIVAENISRKLRYSKDIILDTTESTISVMKPVLASILTTCAAFIPLFFFTGRFGLFVKYIPVIVFLMLFASLIESAFILPSHMVHPGFLKSKKENRFSQMRMRIVDAIEALYQGFLQRLLPLKSLVFLLFAGLLVLSGYLASKQMKYVMFPREEASEIFVTAKGPEGINRFQMEALIKPLEKIFLDHAKVEAVRTSIGQSRRGGEVRENEASLRIELMPPSKRKVPLRELLALWGSQSKEIPGLQEIRFLRSWWGSDSGSPIEIEVHENNDELREKTILQLQDGLLAMSEIDHVEIEKPVTRREYKLWVDKPQTSRLNIDFEQLSSTVRSYVEGRILYTLIDTDEEVDVRLTSQDKDKKDIRNVLQLHTANRANYMVPIKSIVRVEETEKPANIARVNFKRSTKILADLKEGQTTTPLEVASYLEENVFPSLTKGNATTELKFRGEIENSRESQGDFLMSIILVLLLIYILLVFLFNSLATPLLIGIIIPFGVAGVVLAFMSHGMVQYGFFAVIGTLGMIGVVINDAIVMISKLENEINLAGSFKEVCQQIASVCTTRLRPVILTTLTTVAGIFPTAYGIAGYDSMLSEMMLAMGWGLLFGTLITLILVPCLYALYMQIIQVFKKAVSQ